MGLSGAKRRTKLSSDPNNTAWSKSTGGFGHKILSAQGWKPGQLLGAKDANHAEHFTAANASHIRVALREDNLGIGAQVGKSNADTFGLSTLSGIFGRLNGKSDEDLQRQQSAQRDVELRSYQTRKFGTMNFVRGGILVGDKIEDLIEEDDISSKPAAIAAASTSVDTIEVTNQKRRTKSTKRKRSEVDTLADDESGQPAISAESTVTTVQLRGKELKALLKAEKRARKEARQYQKSKREPENATSSQQQDLIETPEPAASVSAFAGSRHNVRQRFIQQKRMASMDARALDEILMRKTPVC